MNGPRWTQPGWWLATEPLTFSSPVLVDALAMAGLDLAGLLDVAATGKRGTLDALRVHPLRRERGSIFLMDTAGMLRRCEIQRRGDCLEVSLTLNDNAVLSTHQNSGILNIQADLPETLRLGARGRPLRDLVQHPLLDHDRYRINRVKHFGQLGIVQIVFDAPMVFIDDRLAEGIEPEQEQC